MLLERHILFIKYLYSYFTSSKITHTENQRVINFMVQVRDTISILNNRNQ